jgi:hypothetical protein
MNIMSVGNQTWEDVLESHPDGTSTLTVTGDAKITGDLTVIGDQIVSTEEFIVQAGTVSAPSITTVGDLDTGMYFPAANQVALSAGGAQVLNATSAGAAVTGAITATTTITATTDVIAVGDVVKNGSNSSQIKLKTASENLTCNSGAGTQVSSTFVPANSLVVGLTARITTELAGSGMTTFSIGDGTDVDLFGAGIALAAGTLVNVGDWTASPMTYAKSGSASAITLTADAGQFDSGVIRLVVYYYSLTAPAA